MGRPKEVAVILDTGKDYDRRIARGAARFAAEAGDWQVYMEDDPADRVPAFARWRGHGILADLDDPIVARAVLAQRVPVVGVGGAVRPELVPPGVSYVVSDNDAIAELAADHLLERGLRSFAYCGLPRSLSAPWSEARETAFRRRVEAAGHHCAVHHGRHRHAVSWDALTAELGAWLAGLPKPCGLMACDDSRARQVLVACRRAGVAVPEQVAVVGVDDDEIMCELATPPLTSVVQGAEAVGYRAAAQLDRMMRTGRRAARFETVPPAGVTARRSSDLTCVADPEVTAALALIRGRVADRLDVADVARHVGLARRTIDLRFQAAIGRTVGAEIRRVRLEAAKKLLANTDLPLRVVAARSGYAHPAYLVAAFRRAVGVTPGAFRNGR